MHNKTAYFVNALYQVDKITPQRFTQWQQLGRAVSLSLPALNPYILDIFTLSKASRKFKKLQLVLDRQGLHILYMSRCYFADKPKANVAVAWRNAKAINFTRNQLLLFLIGYLAIIALA